MVLAINPGVFVSISLVHSEDKSFDSCPQGPVSLTRYKALAAQAPANVAPPEVVGGVLSNAPGAVAGWQITRAK
jgi:hypothetical protein